MFGPKEWGKGNNLGALLLPDQPNMAVDAEGQIAPAADLIPGFVPQATPQARGAQPTAEPEAAPAQKQRPAANGPGAGPKMR